MYRADYLARLKMQTAATAKALLDGCWRIFEGQFFDVWEPQRGMRPGLSPEEIMALPPGTGPMVIPRRWLQEQWWWPRWVSSDYGFTISITAAHLLVHTPPSHDWPRGRVVVLEELGCQEEAAKFGKMLVKRWILGDDGQPVEYRWMPWYLSPDAYRETGTPFTLAGQINEALQPYGRSFIKADNDRVGGHMKLYTGFEGGELLICQECPKTIEAIESRIHDEDNENDVKKVPGDELDDYSESLRYGYKSFETARTVRAPAEVRIKERMEEMWKTDPTAAMFNAGKIRREETERDSVPRFQRKGSAARRQISEWERNRRR
jgi:hypothetical protein